MEDQKSYMSDRLSKAKQTGVLPEDCEKVYAIGDLHGKLIGIHILYRGVGLSSSSTGDLNAATEILQRMGIARDGVWTGDKACVVQVRSSTCLIRKVSIPWPSLTARGVEWRHRGSRQLVPADRRALPKSRAAGRQGRRALPHAPRQSRGRAEIAPRDRAEIPSSDMRTRSRRRTSSCTGL